MFQRVWGDLDADEDILAAEQSAESRLTCPLSQSLLVHPMVNSVCQHRYSKEWIDNFLLTQQNSARPAGTPAATVARLDFATQCPACRRLVSLQTLSHDRAAEKELQAYKRALARDQANGVHGAAAAAQGRKRIKEEDLTQQQDEGGEDQEGEGEEGAEEGKTQARRPPAKKAAR